MKIALGLAFLAGFPAFGQYAGPAILARGEQPSPFSELQIRLRPFVSVSGLYDSGLSGVTVTDQGQIASAASPGVTLGWGLSGNHRWRHTTLGVEYKGTLTHYSSKGYYDNSTQSLLFGVVHQFSTHASAFVRETAGLFSRNYSVPGTSSTVPFDPISSYIPATDYFDNRTVYQTLQGGFTLQKSRRLSMNVEGDSFMTRRRSHALDSVVGVAAHGDLQYRLSRRSTLGVDYMYQHFAFDRGRGTTDAHALRASYSIRVAKTLEFSFYGGPMRVESKFESRLGVDPVIAALLGISSTAQIVHTISTIPSVGGRVAKTLSHGVLYISAGHDVTPGNGLFQTSYTTSASAGYGYATRRGWSFNTTVGYAEANSVGTISGQYRSYTLNASAARQLARSVYFFASYGLRSYSSGDYSGYNRTVHGVSVGLSYSPGDIPLRLW